jgi:hypothetical protein
MICWVLSFIEVIPKKLLQYIKFTKHLLKEAEEKSSLVQQAKKIIVMANMRAHKQMEDCNNHLNETQEQLNTFFIKFEGLGEEQSTTNVKKTL